MPEIEVGERGTSQWFKYVMLPRVVLFVLAAWLGIWIGTWPFAPSGMARAGYAFNLALWTGIPSSIAYMLYLGWRDRKAGKEAPSQTVSVQDVDDAQREAWRHDFKGLFIGHSTGFLQARKPDNSGWPTPEGTPIELSPEDAAKNILVLGGIGSGKTTRSVNPLLSRVLQQNPGALIFDIKTDYRDTAEKIAEACGRPVKIVGDGGMTLNLFRGCTPEVAASYLKSCFLAEGQGHGDSAFWVDSAVEACRHSLNLLNLLDPPNYSIAGCYEAVFFDSVRDKLLAAGAEQIESMTDRQQRLFLQSQRFFVEVWNKHDEKLKRNIMGTINSVLSPFNHPDLVDAFSQASAQGEADLSELIRDGAVFIVNLPVTKYGKEGARFAYLLIKLRFFTMMRERKQHPEWDQHRHVAFICDEYQAIIDPVSDGDFWDKSRSTKTVGIVSMQGVASLTQALGGNRQAADAILQNFRQRIIYRTEDTETLRMIQSVLGQVDVTLTTGSASYSESYSNPTGLHGSASRSESTSETESTSMTRQELFGPADMRALTADQCLFIGNIAERSVDEVLRVEPLYM
ncbi:type IV secretion system DNA-binding domain-containing protein [Klebsiella quasipneumoniae]|uniref:type IV secretion system DNA-binding domain-containing protein n=1 Tax=Klebsiella quasipneumoniae TaxID=1463165 RepID=UPI000C7968B9|nr:type IV secretion system DNA-binding domain-containing protein [Klebsiella quasipneumoniae]PLJ29890.1 hypothetical protein B6J62_19020 [Klebsiella quasipneumoniae]